MSKNNLSAYQRIMEAARKGSGCHLTDEEVAELARDDHIRSTAHEHDDQLMLGKEFEADGEDAAADD